MSRNIESLRKQAIITKLQAKDGGWVSPTELQWDVTLAVGDKQLFGWSPLRRLISDLRKAGYPINSRKGWGYSLEPKPK